MNETYAETYVKPNVTTKSIIVKGAFIAAMVIVALAAILLANIVAILVAVVVIAILLWRFSYLDIAYEYIFVDGQMDFDKIYGGAKRKTAFRIDFEQVDMVVPKDDGRLGGYQNKNCKIMDFTAHDDTAKTYVMAGKHKDTTVLIYFDPNEKMMKAMRDKSRSKVTE